jgi:thiol:disulfide interchange protein
MFLFISLLDIEVGSITNNNMVLKKISMFFIFVFRTLQGKKMDNNKSSIFLLWIATLALTVGLIFSVIYKQHANAEQLHINEWQNWNNNGIIIPKPPEATPIEPEVTPTEPKSYQEALSMSKKNGKQIFLFFHADWCHWCKKMERETLSKEEVKQALSNYIVYFVDTGKESSVARKYVTGGIPTYVITNHTEIVSKRGSGYKSSRDFINWLNNRQPSQPSNPGRNPG